MFLPNFCRSEKQHLKIPRDIQDAKMLAKVLDRYKDMYYFEVMFGVVVAYVLYPFTKSKSTNPKYEKWHEKSVADWLDNKRVLSFGGDLDPITKNEDPATTNYSRSVGRLCVFPP